MSVRVLYFAACRERTGVSAEELDLDGRTVTAALDALRARHPKLTDVLPRCRVAINQAFTTTNDDVIPANAEIALIPPVAGG
jgi:molybdopterin synthase catalytic subunit